MFHNKLEILYYAKKGGFTTVFTGRRPYSDMTCVVSIYDASPGACIGAKSGHGTWKTEQSGVSPHLHLCSIYDRRCNSNKICALSFLVKWVIVAYNLFNKSGAELIYGCSEENPPLWW